MIHARLDITYWKSACSLALLRKDGIEPEVGMISSPCDIAILEQLREESYAKITNTRRFPTDAFVWYRGEPDRREKTKIGGLPYRRAGAAWPMTSSGMPMTFVGQICFSDSQDIVSSLPGDVLLIFAEYRRIGANYETPYDLRWGDGLALEWVKLGNFPLVSQVDIPISARVVMECYAEIHRTWDYLDVNGSDYPYIARDIPPITEATKIGGICPWLYELDYCRFDREIGVPGTYLATLTSVSLNVTERHHARDIGERGDEGRRSSGLLSLEHWRQSRHQTLMIGDVGLLNFFIDDRGRVRWTAHCQT